MKTITQKLTQGAMMVALATALSFFAVFKLPNGGSITVASMVPIILFSYFWDIKWGILTAIAYAGIQMIFGFYPPPTQDMLSFVLVILLDYIVAFGVLGLAGTISKIFKNKTSAFVGGTIIVVFMRFLCHFISGIIIWNVYAPEGQPAWLYSLLYNGSYMLGELVVSVIVMLMLSKYIDLSKFKKI